MSSPEPIDRPGYCNTYNRYDGLYCGQPAGARTGYRVGPCWLHGGRLPANRLGMARETYKIMYAGRRKFGQVLPVDPAVGILDVIAHYAGLVDYLNGEIAAMADADGYIPLSASADNIKLLMQALREFAQACKMAGDLKVELIKTDLISAYQDRMLETIERVLTGAGLDADDPAISELVAAQLALTAGPGAA